jgi:Leucine-rich repeat (LRR) protein
MGLNMSKTVRIGDKKYHINRDGLDLHDNHIIKLPNYIDKFVNLQILYLNNNQLVKLPQSVAKLVNLRILNLNKNQLIKLPTSIGKLVNLQELYLGDNQLVKLPKSMGKMINLRWLCLYNNRLVEIPYCIVNMNIIYIALSNNPFLNGDIKPNNIDSVKIFLKNKRKEYLTKYFIIVLKCNVCILNSLIIYL